ncbi:MAG: asparaginase [Kineosporiaceae bacterium]
MHPPHDQQPGQVTLGVYTLGGTIAMTTTVTPASVTSGVVPTLTATDLLAAVPGLADAGVELAAYDVRQRPGASLTMADVAHLAATIIDHHRTGAITAAVVTQGTDTIEETAWLLHLLLRLAGEADVPVVVTGAMRNPTLAGADGPANLLAAVQVAASTSAPGLGVTVVFGDTVHAAADVRKAHTTSVTAFTSPTTGPIGDLVEARPRIWRRPTTPPLPPGVIDPGRLDQLRVPVLPAALGADPGLIDAIAAGTDGLVVAGFGVGHVPDTWVAALQGAAAAMPVVLTSRIGVGSTATSTYAFPGSEQDLLARGLVNGGHLDPYKARILLQVLLHTDSSLPAIEQAFRQFGGLPDNPGAPPVRREPTHTASEGSAHART